MKVCPPVLFIGTYAVHATERSGFSCISAPWPFHKENGGIVSSMKGRNHRSYCLFWLSERKQ